MSATVPPGVPSAPPPPTPALHFSNILGSPGSTWSGAAAILAVLASAMSAGFPTTEAGWVTFVVAVVTGVGSIFSKA